MTGRAKRNAARALAALAALALAPPAPCANAAAPAMIGEIVYHSALHEDTLVDLALRYNVGYTELRAANPGIDPWLPGAGTRIVVPTAHLLPDGPREGVVVNLADQRLYFFGPGGGAVASVPVGIGSAGWDTPVGATRIVRKRERPYWYVPASIRAEDPDLPAVVPPGPNNPLGAFALNLGWPAYVIHGTNKPYGVGRRVSHGCVRLYPRDIAWLFGKVEIGTPVRVVDQPMKLAWVGDELMLEVHPSQAQADRVEAGERPEPDPPAEYRYRIVEKAAGQAAELDWRRIAAVVRERSGLPVAILTRAPGTAAAPAIR